MTTPLFLDKPAREVKFEGQEKYAGMLTPLGDDTQMWPQEVLDAAYKQLPFLSDFDVFVEVDRLEEERGFGIGSLVVQDRTMKTTKELEAAQPKVIHIPWIVRERHLAPMDVFVDGGKYNHLTEGRVRSALVNPEMFDSVRERPPEPSIFSNLQPPLADHGFGGGTKVASALLPQLTGRVRGSDLDKLKSAMQDPVNRMWVANAGEGVRAAFETALGLERSDPVKTAEATFQQIKPNVVQVRKLDNGNYLLKTANSEMYAPQQEEVPPEMAEEMISDLDLTPVMEADGTVTASPDAVAKRTLDAEEVKAVDMPGVWKVQDKMGNTLTGWAFPQLLDLDMQPMPLTLFTNGSEFALQDYVAGAFITKSADLPRGRMQGYGALYYLDHGTPRVFVPMTVQSSYRGEDGSVHYMAVSDMGQQVDLVFSAGLKVIQKYSTDQSGMAMYALPENMHGWWLPLKAKTELVNEPMMFTKVARALPQALGEIISDGSVYSFRGMPFAKLASSQHTGLNRPDAEFLAVAAGMDPSGVKEALDKAKLGRAIVVPGMRTVWGAKEKMASARAKVAKALENLPLRRYNLVKEAALINSVGLSGKSKEAAALDDALTADKILGLGFLNAENVATFVDMLPGLEYALTQVADMLMASRMGLKDIPEVALERMMIALEDVIQGLRTLQQREVTFGEA